KTPPIPRTKGNHNPSSYPKTDGGYKQSHPIPKHAHPKNKTSKKGKEKRKRDTNLIRSPKPPKELTHGPLPLLLPPPPLLVLLLLLHPSSATTNMMV
ncbi:hypothetical protein BT69DRAFT_1290069, partial [Atractiella rhizophila]